MYIAYIYTGEEDYGGTRKKFVFFSFDSNSRNIVSRMLSSVKIIVKIN